MNAHWLVHVNASLNGLATLLLMVGLLLIKRRQETAHKWTMLAAFGVSIAFLACYLYYHLVVQLQTPFPHPGAIRYVYFTILISHIVLAMTVPFLAIITIVLGLLAHRASETSPRYRALHRRWAHWTFPIWLYVSVTGVVVYWMLYHL